MTGPVPPAPAVLNADLLLVPPSVGTEVLRRLRAHPGAPIGTVVLLHRHGRPRYGFFLPPGSFWPPWPDFCDHLPAGAPLEPLRHPRRGDGRLVPIHRGTGGRLYSRHLHLYAVVTGIAESFATRTLPYGPVPDRPRGDTTATAGLSVHTRVAARQTRPVPAPRVPAHVQSS